jgi:quercetin dioxygenase-like cupin family protein
MALRMRTLRLAIVAMALVIGLVVLVVLVVPARGTPPVGQRTEVLSRGTIANGFRVHVDGIKMKIKGPVDVAVAQLSFDPGGTTGWHSHPGPVLVTVKSGTVTRYLADGCVRETFTVGQGFVELPGHVHMVRNEGATPAQTVASFIVPVGAPLRIDAPAPAGCNP